MSDAAALGAARSPYPQAADPTKEGRLDRLAGACRGAALRHSGWLRRQRLARIVAVTNAAARALAKHDPAELNVRRRLLRAALRREGLHMDLVGDAFALIRHDAEACLGLRLTDSQLMGGWAALSGHIAEMGPGEGKTLAAALAAATVAMMGRAAHVICATDAAARRDGERLAPLYESLGLSLGIIAHDDQVDARQAAYGLDVTYGASAEFSFDYLRDRMVLGAKTGDVHLMLDRLRGPRGRTGKLIMRGLDFAVIDDAHDVLLDQARAPQAISGEQVSGDERAISLRAFAVVDGLEQGIHFTIEADGPRVSVTDQGKTQIRELIDADNAEAKGPMLRYELIGEALLARFLLRRDRHYVVREGRVFIVNDRSGEITADRQWSGGLQQLIEVKEGCEPSGRRVTLARMSYQSYFSRYRQLGGLSSVAREGVAEFWSTYRLAVIRIAASRRGRRRRMANRLFATAELKYMAIAARVVQMAGQDRPVHIAAPSAETAAAVADCLTDMGIPFADISQSPNTDSLAVTLSAAMTGFGEETSGRGGLHVIIAEPHGSRRDDLWLAQRCGWGDAHGSHESFLSLQDGILDVIGGVTMMVTRLFRPWPVIGPALAHSAARSAQAINERKQIQLRRELLMYDRQTSRMLAFTGRGE